MKTCKIILIVLYAISVIWSFIKVYASEDEEQLPNFFWACLDAVIYAVLYKGAGIFDI